MNALYRVYYNLHNCIWKLRKKDPQFGKKVHNCACPPNKNDPATALDIQDVKILSILRGGITSRNVATIYE